MRVVSVILDPKVIQKIMKSVGIKDELLESSEDSRGPPENSEKGERGFEEFYGPDYENKYDDCFDIDYYDQF